ncbi:MAG: helix-turn-helix domain-containing protein [Desulfonatronovibrio sp.]
MQTQQMAHAQITIPADSIDLLTALVDRLGGQVLHNTLPGLPCDPMPNIERGGKMLKALRQRTGFTQKDVAGALGIPQSHISEFERGKRNIPCKHAQKLAGLLHTLPSHFMKPNSETIQAMNELENGKGQHFTSAEKLFDDLEI